MMVYVITKTTSVACRIVGAYQDEQAALDKVQLLEAEMFQRDGDMEYCQFDYEEVEVE